MGHTDQYGRRRIPLPRSLANVRRGIAEKKWEEERSWSERSANKKKYRMPGKKRCARTQRWPEDRTGWAEWFHRLRTGHCRTGQYRNGRRTWTRRRAGGVGTSHRQGTTCSKAASNGRRNRSLCGQGYKKLREATGRGKNRFAICDLLADERYTHSVLNFLRTTKVGCSVGPRAVPPKPGEGGQQAWAGGGRSWESEAGGRGSCRRLQLPADCSRLRRTVNGGDCI